LSSVSGSKRGIWDHVSQVAGIANVTPPELLGLMRSVDGGGHFENIRPLVLIFWNRITPSLAAHVPSARAAGPLSELQANEKVPSFLRTSLNAKGHFLQSYNPV